MPLPTSGQLSLNDIQVEFGGTNPISLTEYYAGGGFVPAGTSGTNGAVPSSGTISVLSFYGTQSVILKGYWGGGNWSQVPVSVALPVTNEIDGIQFSNESAINPSATLVGTGRENAGGFSSSTRGYFAGGSTCCFYTASAEVDGIQFSNEAAINPANGLSGADQRVAQATVNSTTRGYTSGYASTGVDVIKGWQFSTETAFTFNRSVTVAKYQSAGVSSSTNGYFAGGFNTNDFRRSSEFRKEITAINFSNETYSTLSQLLPVSFTFHTGVNSTTKGYFAGGGAGTVFTSLNFSNDTNASTSASLVSARSQPSGTNSFTRGYTSGGGQWSNEIDGIQFSDETSINPSATLALARRQHGSVQNGGLL
jgi:hypothetical protein